MYNVDTYIIFGQFVWTDLQRMFSTSIIISFHRQHPAPNYVLFLNIFFTQCLKGVFVSLLSLFSQTRGCAVNNECQC